MVALVNSVNARTQTAECISRTTKVAVDKS